MQSGKQWWGGRFPSGNRSKRHGPVAAILLPGLFVGLEVAAPAAVPGASTTATFKPVSNARLGKKDKRKKASIGQVLLRFPRAASGYEHSALRRVHFLP